MTTRSRWLSVTALGIASALLAGCGDPAGVGAATRTPSAADAPATTALPTLPPPWILEPGLYDEEGCAFISESESVCPAPPLPSDVALTPGEGEDEWQVLLGYIGPLYASELTGEVQVLEQTVRAATEGAWVARGLVRNQTGSSMRISLAASLYDADAKLLATVPATVYLDVVRPGEPAAFEAMADIPAESVYRVAWGVVPEKVPDAAIRDFEILQFWQVPYGDRARMNFDPAEGTPPFVLYGAARSLYGVADPVSKARVGSIRIIAAWVDQRFRVHAVTEAMAGFVPNDRSMSQVAPDILEPRGHGDFYLVLDQRDVALGAGSGQLMPIMWATGWPA